MNLSSVFRGLVTSFSVCALTQSASAAEPSEWSYSEANGLMIAYRTFGKGEPLVLLNGGPGRSSDTFTQLAKLISSDKRQVILFDQRGTGRSRPAKLDNSTISLDLMVEDLEALRRRLGIDSLSVLGHSFGGIYAMAYAAKYPKRVKSLLLSASGGIDLSWKEYVVANQLARLDARNLARYRFWTNPKQLEKSSPKARLEALRAVIPAYLFDKKFVPEVERALVNEKYYVPEVNDLVWNDLRRKKFDLKAAFKDFAAQVLVVDCRQDFLGEAVPMTIHASFPSSKLIFIDECSHYPWLEKPDSYFKILDEFFDPNPNKQTDGSNQKRSEL